MAALLWSARQQQRQEACWSCQIYMQALPSHPPPSSGPSLGCRSCLLVPLLLLPSTAAHRVPFKPSADGCALHSETHVRHTKSPTALSPSALAILASLLLLTHRGYTWDLSTGDIFHLDCSSSYLCGSVHHSQVFKSIPLVNEASASRGSITLSEPRPALRPPSCLTITTSPAEHLLGLRSGLVALHPNASPMAPRVFICFVLRRIPSALSCIWRGEGAQ